MYLLGPVTFTLDFSLFLVALVLCLASLGWYRGPRTEAITLGGIGGAGLILGSNGTREQAVELGNGLTRVLGGIWPAAAGGLLRGSEQRILFCLAVFGLAVAAAYFAGTALGGKGVPDAMPLRLMGGILGGLSGFAIGLTLVSLGQGYLGRESGDLRIALPTLQLPIPSGRYFLVQYAPLVFLGAFFLLAVLAMASSRKAKARLR